MAPARNRAEAFLLLTDFHCGTTWSKKDALLANGLNGEPPTDDGFAQAAVE